MQKKLIASFILFTLGLILSGLVIMRSQVQVTADEPVATPAQALSYKEPVVNEPEEEPALVIEQSSVQESAAPQPTYTDEELEILALIVYQEAGGDAVSDSTRQLVAQVFLNRVADSRFPDSFYDVATAKGQYGKLHWTGIQWPDRASSEVEAHAIERAYKIAQEVLEAEEPICPEGVIFQAEFVQGEVYAHQDGMYFCFG